MTEKIHTYCHNCKTMQVHAIIKTTDKVKIKCAICDDISYQYKKEDYENYEKNLVKKHLRK